jgi:hypothetical protein
VSSINFSSDAMPVSLPKILISFSCLIDLKEMPIDEYFRQLLPESKSTQIGNPAWMICKYAMFGHVAAYSLSKRFYILDTFCYFCLLLLFCLFIVVLFVLFIIVILLFLFVIFLRSCFSRSFQFS